jgi:hypothetical protein
MRTFWLFLVVVFTLYCLSFVTIAKAELTSDFSGPRQTGICDEFKSGSQAYHECADFQICLYKNFKKWGKRWEAHAVTCDKFRSIDGPAMD